MSINRIVPSPEEINYMQQRREGLLRNPQRIVTIRDSISRQQDDLKTVIIFGSIMIVLGAALLAVGLSQVIPSPHNAWWAAVAIASVVLIIPGGGMIHYGRGASGRLDCGGELRQLPAFVAQVIQAEQNRVVGGSDWRVYENLGRNNNPHERCFRLEYLCEDELVALWPHRMEPLRYSNQNGHQILEVHRQNYYDRTGAMAGSLIERIIEHPRCKEFAQIILLGCTGTQNDKQKIMNVLAPYNQRVNLSALSDEQYTLLHQQQDGFYFAIWKDVRSLYFIPNINEQTAQGYIDYVLPTLISALKEKFGEGVGAELGKKIGLRLGRMILPNNTLGAVPHPAFTFSNDQVKINFIDGTFVQEFKHALARENLALVSLFQRGLINNELFLLERGGPLAAMAITFSEASTLPSDLSEGDLLQLKELATRLGNQALNKRLERYFNELHPFISDDRFVIRFGDGSTLTTNRVKLAATYPRIDPLLRFSPLHYLDHPIPTPDDYIPGRIVAIGLKFTPEEGLPDNLTLADYRLLANAAEYLVNASLKDKIIDHFVRQDFFPHSLEYLRDNRRSNNMLSATLVPEFTFSNRQVRLKFVDGTFVDGFTHALARANLALTDLFESNQNSNEFILLNKTESFLLRNGAAPLISMACTFSERSTLPSDLSEEDLLKLKQLAICFDNKVLKERLLDREITLKFEDGDIVEVNMLTCATYNATLANLLNNSSFVNGAIFCPLNNIPSRIAAIAATFTPTRGLPDNLTLNDYILLADAAEYFDNRQLRDKIIDHFARQSFASFLEPLKQYKQELFNSYVPNIFERAWNLHRIGFF